MQADSFVTPTLAFHLPFGHPLHCSSRVKASNSEYIPLVQLLQPTLLEMAASE
jgi:hypothetical protein